MHKYKVDDILYFNNNNQKVKCKITELFHLVYRNKYPTYKIELLEEYKLDTDLEFDCKTIIKKMVAPECMLSEE